MLICRRHCAAIASNPLYTSRRITNPARAWDVVIGLEVHAQIKSRTKLFSLSQTPDSFSSANTHVHAFDAAFPGSLPILNATCVDLALRTALALGCAIQEVSSFDRKHYFYADLPSGYQITQHYAPVAIGGKLHLQKSNKFVAIKQIQLEQDTAKSISSSEVPDVLVDLNRAGCGLMEIVTEPDMRTPEEAGDFVRSLQLLLQLVGSSDGRMDRGSLRCDANVSVNPRGAATGTRSEIKNLNSVRFMVAALLFEIERQITLLSSGQIVPHETRGFDEDNMQTYRLRNKEASPDYRYMPDPNLPPLRITKAHLESVRKSMPSISTFGQSGLNDIGLTLSDTQKLLRLDSGKAVEFDGGSSEDNIISFFVQVAKDRDAKIVLNWIANDLHGHLGTKGMKFSDNHVSPQQLGELIDMVQSGQLTGTSGRSLLKILIDERLDASPFVLAKDLSILAIDESNSMDKLCTDAIESLPEEAEAIAKGNIKVINKLVGFIMKRSNGRLAAVTVRKELLRRLSKQQ